jgi:hypothetical protein
MSGKLYICRVVREFGMVVDGRFVMRNIGDEVARETEPADASHLELVRVEGDGPAELPASAEAPAGELVVNPASAEAPEAEQPAPAEALQTAAIPAKPKRSASA